MCCSVMAGAMQVLVDGAFTSAVRPIGYDPVFDEFRTHDPSAPTLSQCPWCGAALGPSRRTDWYDRLAELGLTPNDDLPSRLLTDGWWAGAPTPSEDEWQHNAHTRVITSRRQP